MFTKSEDRWSNFYQRFGLDLSPPNLDGWSSCHCALPTHRKGDHERKGGVNLESGSYKCWIPACMNEAFEVLSKNPNSKIITPREFLILAQGFSLDDAEKAVDAYRESNLGKDLEGNPGLFGHNDETFTSAFSPLPPHIADAIYDAKLLLSPELDIVQEYTNTRGITYETLVKAGCGYLPQSEGQEECLLLPYFLNGQIVGVRGRTIDGRKGGIKGSYQTLYNLDSILQDQQTVIVVEGETDTLYTSQILAEHNYYVPVVGTPGVEFKHEWRRHLASFGRIIAIPQDDRAAQRFIENLRREFAERLEVVALPWKVRQHGKDISDFCRLDPNNKTRLVELMGLSAQDQEPRKFLLTDKDLLREARKKISWIIPGVIERGTKTLLVGAPKSRKTWLCLDIARSVTQKQPFMGIPHWTPTSSGKVVLIEEEGSTSRLAQRWKKVCPEPNENFFVIHRQQIKLDDIESITHLKQELIPLNPDLIIFDPYANLHLQDENNAQGTMIVMSAFNSILRSLPRTTVLIVHHTTKSGETPRGSSALWASVDTQIALHRSDKDVITLVIEGRELTEGSEGLEFMFDGELGRHTPTGGLLDFKLKERPKDPERPKDSERPKGPTPKRYDWLLEAFDEHIKDEATVDDLLEITKRPVWEVRNAVAHFVSTEELIDAGRKQIRGPKFYKRGRWGKKKDERTTSEDPSTTYPRLF